MRFRWPLLVLATLAEAIFLHADLPPDTVVFAEAGRSILTGHWGAVFADPFMQAGPWQLLWDLLLVPTHQPTGPRDVLPQPGALPAFLFWDLVVVLGGALGGRALRRAVGRVPSPPTELLVGVVALVWLVPGPLWTAHTSQVAIPALWTAAACLAWRGRPALAGVLVGISVGWEPWGILAAPVLLAAPRLRGVLVGGLSCAAVTLATYGPFMLTGRFAMFEHVWPVEPATLVHLLRPDLVGFTWPMRALQAAATVIACAAVVLRSRRREDVVWMAPLTATLVRLLLDPTMFSYYWVAASVIGLLGLGMLPASAPLRRWAALVVPMYVSFITYGRWTLLELVLAIVTLIAAAATVGHDSSAPGGAFEDADRALATELGPELTAIRAGTTGPG